jgi:hypothetical protein
MVRLQRLRGPLLVLIFILGLGALGRAGMLAVERQLRRGPAGPTAGGAVTALELCRRSTPPDVAESCVREQERLDREALHSIWRWGALGITGLVIFGMLRWRRSKDRRRQAEDEVR